MWGDQAYRGQRAVIREHAPKARDFTNRRYRHRGVVDEVDERQLQQRYMQVEAMAELVAATGAADPRQIPCAA